MVTLAALLSRVKKLEGRTLPPGTVPWEPPVFPEVYMEAVLTELRQHGQMSEAELRSLMQGHWHELEVHGEGHRRIRVLRNLHDRSSVTLP